LNARNTDHETQANSASLVEQADNLVSAVAVLLKTAKTEEDLRRL